MKFYRSFESAIVNIIKASNIQLGKFVYSTIIAEFHPDYKFTNTTIIGIEFFKILTFPVLFLLPL